MKANDIKQTIEAVAERLRLFLSAFFLCHDFKRL